MATKLGKYYICDRCGTTSFFEKIGEGETGPDIGGPVGPYVQSERQKAGILFIQK